MITAGLMTNDGMVSTLSIRRSGQFFVVVPGQAYFEQW